MDLFIRDNDGKILSVVKNIQGSPGGCNTITTEYGCFTIVELSVNYVGGYYNAYSDSYSITNKYEGTVNQFGTYLESK